MSTPRGKRSRVPGDHLAELARLLRAEGVFANVWSVDRALSGYTQQALGLSGLLARPVEEQVALLAPAVRQTPNP